MSVNITVNGKYVKNCPRYDLLIDSERVRKEAENERRKLRIQQVRDLSKNIAKKVRAGVELEKENQLKKIEEIKAHEMEMWRQNAIIQKEKDFRSSIFHVGEAHRAAKVENNKRTKCNKTRKPMKSSENNRSKPKPCDKENILKNVNVQTEISGYCYPKPSSKSRYQFAENPCGIEFCSDWEVNVLDTSCYSSDSSSLSIYDGEESSKQTPRVVEIDPRDNMFTLADDSNIEYQSNEINISQPKLKSPKKTGGKKPNEGYNSSTEEDLQIPSTSAATKLRFTQISDIIRQQKLANNTEQQRLQHQKTSYKSKSPSHSSKSPQKSQFKSTSNLRSSSPQKSQFKFTSNSRPGSPQKSQKTSSNSRPSSPQKSQFKSSTNSRPDSPQKSQFKSSSNSRPGSPQKSKFRSSSNSRSFTPQKSQFKSSSNSRPQSTQTTSKTVSSRSTNAKVQFYDYNNKFEKQYDQPESVVEIHEPTTSTETELNAVEMAAVENKNRERREMEAEKMRQKADERSQKAIEREQVRRACEELTAKLDALANQRQFLPSDNYQFASHRLQQINKEKETKVTNAIEDILKRPAIITCPVIDQRNSEMINQPVRQPRSQIDGINVESVYKEGGNISINSSDSCGSILLGYVDNQSKQIASDIQKFKMQNGDTNNAKAEKLQNLLSRINKLRENLIKELEQCSAAVPSDKERVQSMVNSITDFRKEREQILVDDSSKESIEKREKDLKKKEAVLEKKLKEFYEMHKAAKKQNQPKTDKSEETSEESDKLMKKTTNKKNNEKRQKAQSTDFENGNDRETRKKPSQQTEPNKQKESSSSEKKPKQNKLNSSETQESSTSEESENEYVENLTVQKPVKIVINVKGGRKHRKVKKPSTKSPRKLASLINSPVVKKTRRKSSSIRSYDSNSTSYRSLPSRIENNIDKILRSPPKNSKAKESDREKQQNKRSPRNLSRTSRGEEIENEKTNKRPSQNLSRTSRGEETDKEKTNKRSSQNPSRTSRAEEIEKEKINERSSRNLSKTSSAEQMEHDPIRAAPSLNPLLAQYVQRLLGMSKASINALGVSSSEIETPSSSILNTPSNISAADAEKLLSSRLENVQKFIEDNYSFVGELEESLRQTNTTDSSLKVADDLKEQKSKASEGNNSSKPSSSKLSANQKHNFNRDRAPEMTKRKERKTKNKEPEVNIPKRSSLKQSSLSEGPSLNSEQNIHSTAERGTEMTGNQRPSQSNETTKTKEQTNKNKEPKRSSLKRSSTDQQILPGNQRIAELNEMITQVRKEKQKILEATLSSASESSRDRNSTEYLNLPEPQINTDESSSRILDSHILESADISKTKSLDSAPLLLEKDKLTGMSRDSGISMSRPITVQESHGSPIHEIPKLQSSNESLSGHSKKPKPPLSRYSPQLPEDVPHELSTIFEVETPATSRLNKSTAAQNLQVPEIVVTECADPNVAYKKFHSFETYVKINNLDMTQFDPEFSAQFEREFNELINHAKDGKTVGHKEFESFNKYLEKSSSGCTNKDTAEELLASLKVANLSFNKFPTRSEYLQNICDGNSGLLDSRSIENIEKSRNYNSSSSSSSSLLNIEHELKIRDIIFKPLQNLNIQRENLGRGASSIASTSNRLHNKQPADISGIKQLTSCTTSTDENSFNMEEDFKKIGIDWPSIMKRKTMETQALSSSTSSNTGPCVFTPRKKNNPCQMQANNCKKRVQYTTDNTIASEEGGQHLNLRDFLKKELLKRTATSTSHSLSDDSVTTSILRSIIGSMTPFGQKPNNVAHTLDRHKTSTPMASQSLSSEKVCSKSQGGTSSIQLFSGESRLSSVHFDNDSNEVSKSRAKH